MAGIYAGIGLTGLIALMFLYSALTDTSADWVYFGLYILLNPGLIYLSYMFYPTAHAYYIPQLVEPTIKNEVIETPEEEKKEEEKPEEP